MSDNKVLNKIVNKDENIKEGEQARVDNKDNKSGNNE